jgi:endonuclease/exonuclease/phosphatase family metal-dependent hydrolase
MNKIIKRILLVLMIVVLVLVSFVGSYCGYIYFSYERIGDTDLDITSGSKLNNLVVGQTYSATTYNVGFGAYSQDFTFFLDTGYDIDGNETCGYYSKARSKEEALFNINGSVNTIKELDSDFVFLQEVDVNSTRSYRIDQNELFFNGLKNYDNVFSCNFNTAYLPYPLYDMHGSSYAGLSTFSKYKIDEAHRFEYTISEDFSKFFDCDRCFSVSLLNVDNGKKLYLVNSHMSAYDKGGVIKEKQITELNSFLKKCKDEDNYVIVGGDFNHDLITNNPNFDYTSNNKPFNNVLKNPDWIASYFDENGKNPLIEGYKVVASDNAPTCRNNDIKWNPELTYKCVVDGFITSDNIEITKNYNVVTKNGNLGIDGFAYSDHQPAYIEFKLK